MPAAAPGYAQFLAPQRAGEEVPGSQIQTQGPFSAELTQPAFIAPNVKPTGYGGAGQAMLHFANQFLAGASEGRLRQFQQSEQTKKEHERNYDATVQHIQDSPLYTRAFKEQVLQDALTAKASAGKAALGGKPGKNDHPMVGLAHSIFDHVIGPSENKKHTDIGPEHVSDLITQMHDKGNIFNAANASEQSGAGVSGIIKEMQDAAKQNNTGPIYQEDVPNHPKFAEVVRPLTSENLNPLQNEGVSSRLSVLPHRPSAEAVAKSKMPVKWIWRDEQGNLNPTSVRISPEGQVQDLSGVAIPIDSPIIKNGGIAGQFDVASQRVAGAKAVQDLKNNATPKETYGLRQDALGNWVRIQTGGFPKTLVPPLGAGTQPPASITTIPPAAASPDAAVQGQPAADGSFDLQGFAEAKAKENGVDPNLFKAVVGAESGFNPAAVGPVTANGDHAQGIAQLMPATAKAEGVNPMDPAQGLEAGAKILGRLMVKYKGDTKKALAAYNFGEGNVDSGKPLPKETTDYIDKVTKDQQAFANTNATQAPGTQAPATVATAQPRASANPHEGIVSTGIVKPSASAPVTWTTEQNTLAQAPVARGGRRDAFVETWPLQDRTLIKAIGNYEYKAPGGTKGALTSPRVSSMIASAKIYNPAFSAEEYDNRAAMKKNYLFGGKGAENITSLDTALVHLGGLDEAATKLDNSAFRKYNTFANWLVKESGSPQAKAFQNDRTVVSEELARALKGGVATEAEVKQWEHNIDTADSPAQLRTSTQTIAKIIAGRLGEQSATYERGMGEPPPRPFVSPEAQKVLTRLGGNGTPGAPNPNPSGFVVGHRYRDMEYLGGDPNSAASWKK